MNIVLTGSIGRIGTPLTSLLIAQGHSVTVISSNPDRQKAIENMGAKAAIGSIEDVSFLTTSFKGADRVYLMFPPVDFLDHSKDMTTCWLQFANNYRQAVISSGVTKIIHLSSIGGHTDQGVGILAVHHWVENTLKQIPESVSIKTMRPVGFYYNMFAFIPSIKKANAIIQNYGDDEKDPWVSPLDIADVVAEEMETEFNGRSIRYIASDEVSPNEIASVLGQAIGKPDLQWRVIPNEDFENDLLKAGFGPKAAKGFTEMNAARRTRLYEDYKLHKPPLGKIKLNDFSGEFARIYNR